jgi:acetyl-CoA carboxylase biotin carboxylase subunit
MGNKAEARRLAREAGVPVVPGTLGTVSPAEATQVAEDIGYPILVKAAAGGGGRGIRAVEGATDLDGAVRAAAREARAAFGDDSLYLERQLLRPRHVEVQVIGDTHGNLVHLFDRECSLQRHRQKIIEEAPSPAVSPETRAAMTEAAVRLARATGYTGAGTIEFLLEGEDFYFIEMNTRIQVEHTVTEMITGVDIVEQQFRVALGGHMSFTQDEIRMDGCAIELRINAEDPERGFFPSPGVVTDIEIPGGPGVRVDSALYPGAAVQPFYDSLISKLIVWKQTRPGAVARARRAADEYKITGIETTLPLLRRLIDDEAFVRGEYHVNYLEALLEGVAASARL